ncbi:MAG TPA: clostripain-related cysteine peptidase [Anaerolineales bacterium]|nr:clostripain-related cysteine peptidase [Anaerolineales bacterium]
MRKVHVTLALLTVFGLLATMTCNVYAAPPAPQAEWTVMVYISGDNNLESYVVGDIETELAAIPASNTDVQVVALADRGPGYDTSRGDWTQTLLYDINTGITADEDSAADDWGERNMGDPQTLIDFVTWTKANHPADHYALYFWGHGWSWHPGWVMEDDTDGDTLDYHEMKAAIPSLGFIDVVGYDGCNMSSMEIFDLWHGHATAVTSSQEWVGGEGIQYELVLAQLAANPNMSADQVAIATSQSASADKTWSAVAVDARFTELVDAVDDWSAALQAGLGANRKKYDQAFTATRSFWQAPMDKDLYDMAYEIHRLVNNQTIRSSSQRVMAAVDAVVLHERHVNAYADAHGITIYHISKASQKDSDYRYYRSTIDFALETGWDEFVDTYAK